VLLVLTLGSAACDSGRTPRPTPQASPGRSSASPPPVLGPSVSTTEEARQWMTHWVRAFIPFGQEVVQFRQANRDGDLPRMAAFARPLDGAIRQLSAAIDRAGRPPSFLVSRVRGAVHLLGRTRQLVLALPGACHPATGSGCREAGQELYDATGPLLAAFATIFRTGGIPIPSPS